MADTLTHRKQTALAATGADIDKNEWNDTHVLAGGVNGQFLQRDSTQLDGWKWATVAASAFSVIQQIITAASQTTVDFLAIPQTFSGLLVTFVARDTQAGTSSVVMRVRVNADAVAANYTAAAYTGIQNGAAVNATNAPTTSGVFCLGIPQDGNTVGIANQGILEVMGYTNTTWHKRLLSHGGWEDGTTALSTFSFSSRWASTAAVTRLTFLTDGVAFKDGSIFTLYGVL